MKKVIGYIIAIVGLALMAISFGTFKIENAFLNALSSNTMTIIGVALIIVGIFISLKAEKGSREYSEEVPIYEGSGKHRKIVGYQRKCRHFEI